MDDSSTGVKREIDYATLRKKNMQAYISSAFPPQGTEQRAHEGSQSMSPPKLTDWSKSFGDEEGK